MAPHLPAELTSFVGRTAELAEVTRLVDRNRLVTLTGPGGVGKTRIAVRAAKLLADACPDGAALVQLSDLRDPDLLTHTIGTTLGLASHLADKRDALVGYLKDRRVLLILDTCEHLAGACARLAEDLLVKTAHVRILATSRQPLAVPGEQILVIPPLPVPGEEDEGEENRRCDALDLLADRAAAAVAGFTIDATNRSQALKLCRGLDGIPLALELAAVRLRALSLDQLVARLDDRFRLLAGRKTATARHQTLRAMIGWSYELCSPAERLLWARLSVFAGGFDPAAAEAVCAGDGLTAAEIMTGLAALARKSVVQAVPADDAGTWFQLLDSIREYGRERLVNLGQHGAFQHRHQDYYLAQACLFDAGWRGPAQLGWFRRMEREHANLRVALEHALTASPSACLRMCGALAAYWFGTARFGEARYWLERALAAVPGDAVPGDAVPGDAMPGDAVPGDAVPGDQVPDDQRERAHALWALGHVLVVKSEHERAREILARARAYAERDGDQPNVACTILQQGMAEMMAGKYDAAMDLTADALTRFAAAGEMPRQAEAHHQLAITRLFTGDIPGALDHCQKALSLLDDEECIVRSWVLVVQSTAFWVSGAFAGSVAAAGRAARLKLGFGDYAGIGFCLELLGWDAARRRNARDAAWILGAAESIWRKQGLARMGNPLAQAAHETAVRAARDALGDQAFRAAFAAGIALRTDEAVARAT